MTLPIPTQVGALADTTLRVERPKCPACGGMTFRVRMANGDVLENPHLVPDWTEIKTAWYRDMNRRFALDLRLEIIEAKCHLKALQLRLRAERSSSVRKPKPAAAEVQK